jgi:hypothetical protein
MNYYYPNPNTTKEGSFVTFRCEYLYIMQS